MSQAQPQTEPQLEPALAMLDVGDIPRGLLALDLLVKEAWVTVKSAGTVQDGRYLILFGGQVEPVQRAFGRALEVAGDALVDSVCLPWAEERIAPAILEGKIREPGPGDTLGVLQNGSAPSLLRAVDVALKGALVELIQLRIGDGLGGKAIATLWGETHDVEAAVELADEVVGKEDGFGGVAAKANRERWSKAVIRRADDLVLSQVASGTRFFSEWRG